MAKGKRFEASWDKKNDVAYVQLAKKIAKGSAVRQVVIDNLTPGGEIILDFDKNGKLLGMEILGLNAITPRDEPKKSRG